MTGPQHLHSLLVTPRRNVTAAPRALFQCPELWGDELLFIRNEAVLLLAQANREAGQNALRREARRYGLQKTIRWRTYRCQWLYSRTSLRDVEPDEVIQVRPVLAGTAAGYLVDQRWLYRRDFRNMADLSRKVDQFYASLRKDRRRALGLEAA